MDRDRLHRVAKALGDVRLYEKHHTGEFITMRLRDSLADTPGYDAAEVDKKLLELAQVALEAAEQWGRRVTKRRTACWWR